VPAVDGFHIDCGETAGIFFKEFLFLQKKTLHVFNKIREFRRFSRLEKDLLKGDVFLETEDGFPHFFQALRAIKIVTGRDRAGEQSRDVFLPHCLKPPDQLVNRIERCRRTVPLDGKNTGKTTEKHIGMKGKKNHGTGRGFTDIDPCKYFPFFQKMYRVDEICSELSKHLYFSGSAFSSLKPEGWQMIQRRTGDVVYDVL
jgi:hypothetical protein